MALMQYIVTSGINKHDFTGVPNCRAHANISTSLGKASLFI